MRHSRVFSERKEDKLTNIEVQGPRVSFVIPIGNGIAITESVVIGWALIIVIAIICKVLTHNLKKVPESKTQVIAEWAVSFVNDMVADAMGPKLVFFAPYIATIFIYALLGALVSMLGLRSMTADISVTLTWAVMTFVIITFYKIKSDGILGYLKGFLSPIFLMAPMNVISEVSLPVSMAFRMFGNVAGGMIITALVYGALSAATSALGLSIPILTVGIPAVLSAYFDLFSGVIQSYVFIMLTMINVGMATGEDS